MYLCICHLWLPVNPCRSLSSFGNSDQDGSLLIFPHAFAASSSQKAHSFSSSGNVLWITVWVFASRSGFPYTKSSQLGIWILTEEPWSWGWDGSFFVEKTQPFCGLRKAYFEMESWIGTHLYLAMPPISCLLYRQWNLSIKEKYMWAFYRGNEANTHKKHKLGFLIEIGRTVFVYLL